MLATAFVLSLLICLCFARLPGRLHGDSRPASDRGAALGGFLGTWGIAVCVYNSPGITVDFDGFRLLAVTGLSAALAGVILLFRVLKGRFVPLTLALAALACEVFVFNAPYFATHGYQPIDLTEYLDPTSAVEVREDGTLVMDAEHTLLKFTDIGQPLYNLQLTGLQYTHGEPYVNEQNPLFSFVISATDEGASRSRQAWNWDVAWKSERSHSHSLQLSGRVDTLTLQAVPYEGEYIWYTFAYTLDGITANAPRAFAFSPIRLLILWLVLTILWGLRPDSALWRDAYLEHQRRYRPLAALCAAVLCAGVIAAPFADPQSSGVATARYNVNNWDESSRISFTAHINDWQKSSSAQYGSLAHSLLQGRLDLMIDPPEALAEMDNPYDTGLRAENASDALWDVAYYQGRYYVYFGIVPCLLFQLPFELLTGVQDLPNTFGMIVMGCLFVIACFGSVRQALRRWFPKASAAAYLLVCVGLVTSSQLYYLLLRPDVYEYAILCGIAFVMLALWQWMCAANTPVQDRAPLLAHLFLGSLCMALVAGCRPQMEMFAFLALPVFWQRYGKEKRLFTRDGILEAVVFLLPVLVVAAGLMWYSAARFGSVFDFGANYNLTSNDMTKRGFRLGRIGPALFTDFLTPPVLQAVFPYLQGSRMVTNYAGITITEPFYGGILACLPFLWSLFFVRAQRSELRRKPGMTGVILWGVVSSVALAVLDCEMAGVLYRYLTDFLPVMLFAATLMWLQMDRSICSHESDALACLRRPFRLGLTASVGAGMIYNFCVFFAAEPYLYSRNPALYQTVSRLVQFWM